jgi:DNA-binding transcriptional LysR family regulator
VITAVTAQNTRGVSAWSAVTPELVASQLDAVATDLRPRALKSGMLGNEAVVRIVAERIAAHRLDHYVLDPVMVATSGDVLLEPGAVDCLRSELVPLAGLVTPNLPEAELLLGAVLRSSDEMADAARALVSAGAGAALIKGGHLESQEIVDVLFDGQELREFRRERFATRNLHGTYILVDWGPDFREDHAIAFPKRSGARLTLDIGPMAVDYLLASEGSGYLPHRLVRGHLSRGRLKLVARARRFSVPVAALYPEAREESEFAPILDSLRARVARYA